MANKSKEIVSSTLGLLVSIQLLLILMKLVGITYLSWVMVTIPSFIILLVFIFAEILCLIEAIFWS